MTVIRNAGRLTNSGSPFATGRTERVWAIAIAPTVRINIRNGVAGDIQATFDNIAGIGTMFVAFPAPYELAAFYLEYTAGAGQPVTVFV